MIRRKKKFHTLLAAAMFFAMPIIAIAQTPDPGPDPDDPGDVPVDGGITLLVAAGVGYILKKGDDKRKAGMPPKEIV